MDINVKTGAKITGAISNWQKLLSLPMVTGAIETPYTDYYALDKCAHIVDISKWQGLINWLILWSMTDGAIARLGYGTTQDQKWIENRAGLKSGLNKIRGAYHYYNTGATVEQQVNIILESLRYFAPGELEIFALDVEKSFNAYTSSTFRNDPLKILNQVSQARPDLKILHYSNIDVWENYLKMDPAYLAFEQWVAWYPWYPQTTKYPRLPKGMRYEDIYLWQYWADGNGLGAEHGVESGSIDLNRSRDTKAEVLKDLLTVGPEPPAEKEYEYVLSKRQEGNKLYVTVEVKNV